MIESLRIRNLAVVEEAVVDFVPGLNVLTGETGAGKSLILGALGLLTGARASQTTTASKFNIPQRADNGTLVLHSSLSEPLMSISSISLFHLLSQVVRFPQCRQFIVK